MGICRKMKQFACGVAATCLAGPAMADNISGEWSGVIDWPLIAIHAAVAPDGRVFTYGTGLNGSSQGGAVYDLWDPADGGHMTFDNTTGIDIFCSGSVIMPSTDDVFIIGGDVFGPGNKENMNVTRFNFRDNDLSVSQDLMRKRWYSTPISLPNGDLYVQGGRGGADRPEIITAQDQRRLLSGANTSGLNWWYPRNFVLAGGRVFGFDTNGRTYFVDPNGVGALTRSINVPTNSNAGTAVMARQDKVFYSTPQGGINEIDISGATPTSRSVASIANRRAWSNATILPNGDVAFTGGSANPNKLEGVTNQVELLNPETGEITQGATGALARLYHSTATLLTDGRVLVAGGGLPGPLLNSNAEIYAPPYLFDANGLPARRPRIFNAPTSMRVDTQFTLRVDEPSRVRRVTMVKSGSTTHSFNVDQRFLELPFHRDGDRLRVKAPISAGAMTPGYYMLHVIDDAGVPSKAKMVKVSVEADPDATYSDIIAEYAHVDVDHNWRTVELKQRFNDPVVVAFMRTSNGGQLAQTRIRNVGPSSFEIRLQEPSNLDNWHLLEEITYIVAERGAFKLDSGRLFEAGEVLTNRVHQSTLDQGRERTFFDAPFVKAPRVFSSAVNYGGGGHWITVRQANVSRDGFEAALAEEEARTDGHVTEAINFIAVGADQGGAIAVASNRANHRGDAPATDYDFASMQTVRGKDPAVLRARESGDAYLQEDTTRDRETWHVKEIIAYLDLPGKSGFLRGRPVRD